MSHQVKVSQSLPLVVFCSSASGLAALLLGLCSEDSLLGTQQEELVVVVIISYWSKKKSSAGVWFGIFG